MTDEPRIGFIGAGKMGGGMIHGLIERGITPDRIVVCEGYAGRREELHDRYGVQADAAYGPALAADAVVLAVKPQEFAAAAVGMRAALRGDPLLISIMAGVRLDSMLASLPVRRAVRSIPNLGAAVGESFTTWFATPDVTVQDRALVRTLLGVIGREHEVPVEAQVDMATAVGGSGPGFVALLIEGLVDGAVTIGLPRTLATEMVVQTFLGTARWLQQHDDSPAELRAQVMSPGGTTAAGIHALERGGARAALIDALLAAFEKSTALGAPAPRAPSSSGTGEPNPANR